MKAANDRAKAVKERATSTTTQVVEEYKDSDAFENDATMAIVGVYGLRSGDYKKVTIAYLSLNLHLIMVSSIAKEEEEEEEELAAEGEIARKPTAEEGVDGDVVMILVLEKTAIKIPREVAAPSKIPEEVEAPTNTPKEVIAMTEVPKEVVTASEA